MVEEGVTVAHQSFERIGGALLVEHLAWMHHPVVREEDFTALIRPAEQMHLRVELAPHERMHFESVTRVGNRGGAEILLRLGPMFRERCLPSRPEAWHRGAESGRDRVRTRRRGARLLGGMGGIARETWVQVEAGSLRRRDCLRA